MVEIMPKITAFECNRCGVIKKEMTDVTIKIFSKPQQTRNFCDNCLEHFYFSMQRIRNE